MKGVKNEIMDELKLFDAFSGIGALHKALNNLNMPVSLTGISEIDIDAIIAYDAIYTHTNKIPVKFRHYSKKKMRKYLIKRNIGYDFKNNKSKIPRLNKSKLVQVFQACIRTNNYGDISLIPPKNLPDFDLFNFSFPCTKISIAGKQEGMRDKEGNVTSSGLYIYGIKILKVKRPKYIMIENVKNLVSKKFISDFYSIINELNEIGYNCYYPEDKNKVECLNAKDYGIPQNRERIYVICIRKDVDIHDFEFPVGRDWGIRLKDILEDKVDEKYYLSEEYLQRFKVSLSNKKLQHKIPNTGRCEVIGTTVNPKAKGSNSRHWVYNPNKIIGTITATDYKQPKQILDNSIKVIGSTKAEGQKGFDVINRVYSKSPTIDTMQGVIGSLK
jgi:DNA (cytosine-5)-methyltransferase 1